MKTIAPQDLQSLLESRVSVELIDVRTPVEFAEVHVPQARNAPLDRFDASSIKSPTLVYLLCRSGARAAKAAEQLAAAGHVDAIVVEGGTQAWIDAGLPVTRGEVKVISLERQVRIGAGSLVLVGVILGSWVNNAFYGLAAFVGAGLVFAGITDWCGMGLLLAKAPWNQRL